MRQYVYRDPKIERFATPTRHMVHIDAPMTNISIAYRNVNYIADQIFPIVPVVKQSDLYFKFEKGAWFRDEAKVRAPGTRAARVDYSLSAPGPYAAVEYAAAKTVPDEIVDNADNPLNPDREATEFATEKLLIRLEKDVADLVQTSGNWTTTSTANAINNGGAWSADTSDPIKDVTGSSGIRETIRGLIGRYPNVCVMGATVLASLRRHPDLMDRIKYTQLGILTPALIASLFDIDKIIIGTAVINNALEGATDSFGDIWGNYAFFGYVPTTPGLMIPAAGYIFQWKARQVNRYREMEEHQDVIECLQNWDSKVTSADSGYLVTSVV